MHSRRSLITGAAALAAYQWLRPREADARLMVNQLAGFGSATSCSWQTTNEITVAQTNNGANGLTGRQWIDETALSVVGGTKIRVTYTSGSLGEGLRIAKAYIGMRNMAGDVWDFDGNQAQLTWNGGSTSVTIAAGASKVSDDIAFNLTSGADLVLSHFTNDVSNDDFGTDQILDANHQHYTKSGDDAASTDTSGYGADTHDMVVTKIEVCA